MVPVILLPTGRIDIFHNFLRFQNGFLVHFEAQSLFEGRFHLKPIVRCVNVTKFRMSG